LGIRELRRKMEGIGEKAEEIDIVNGVNMQQVDTQ
jgi:hypothetical protein